MIFRIIVRKFERSPHTHTPANWNYTNVMIVFIDAVFANLD